MVAHLMASKFAWRTGLCLLGVMMWSSVQAEMLADPTRPPAELGMAAAGEAEMSGMTAKGPILQSVLISAGRKSAIIGGQVVRLGEKYGEARVVKITENEVVLKTGATTETLRLFPDVEKRLVQGRKK